MAEKPPLKAVKGGRPTAHRKKRSATTKRVVFIPREGGDIDCIEAETLYALVLLQPVSVTVPEETVGYERLDG